jgi:hypothetical protein
VRFASDLPGPVQFVVGGFYSDFHGRLPFSAFTAATVPGLDATGVQLSDIPNLIFASDFYTEVKGAGGFRRGFLSAHGSVEADRRPALVSS